MVRSARRSGILARAPLEEEGRAGRYRAGGPVGLVQHETWSDRAIIQVRRLSAVSSAGPRPGTCSNAAQVGSRHGKQTPTRAADGSSGSRRRLIPDSPTVRP